MILEFQARRLDHGVHTTISRTKTMQKFGEEVAVCRTRNKDPRPLSRRQQRLPRRHNAIGSEEFRDVPQLVALRR